MQHLRTLSTGRSTPGSLLQHEGLFTGRPFLAVQRPFPVQQIPWHTARSKGVYWQCSKTRATNHVRQICDKPQLPMFLLNDEKKGGGKQWTTRSSPEQTGEVGKHPLFLTDASTAQKIAVQQNKPAGKQDFIGSKFVHGCSGRLLSSAVMDGSIMVVVKKYIQIIDA